MPRESWSKLLRKRIADPQLLTLIQRFLKAGVMIEGRREETTKASRKARCFPLSRATCICTTCWTSGSSAERQTRGRQAEANLTAYGADDFIFSLSRKKPMPDVFKTYCPNGWHATRWSAG